MIINKYYRNNSDDSEQYNDFNSIDETFVEHAYNESLFDKNAVKCWIHGHFWFVSKFFDPKPLERLTFPNEHDDFYGLFKSLNKSKLKSYEKQDYLARIGKTVKKNWETVDQLHRKCLKGML